MRLKKIRLAGFKSFVDPTTIPITGSLTGIVGPNGCGKSNIIDAIRWVMGESSAKHLRGDSMADVIFSGSNMRKPVGKAMVELVFNNTEGKAPGQYASYAEIAIRRESGRGGLSDYFINKTKCRRKDITDIFLGTGLGPRTYSIIEQGMVTRIIDSKPEELRGFLEEAAGISRYKERRRETETRIRHTRENLDRLNDIRAELEKQLRRLKRQAKAAARYKDLKQEERLAQARLLTLRWRELETRLKEIDAELKSQQTELERLIAGQREIEAEIEKIRSQQVEVNDHLNAVQKEFYTVGAEISHIEQSIQHVRDTRAQQLREQEQVNRSWEEASQHLESDLAQLDTLSKQLEATAPQMQTRAQARDQDAETLRQAEQAQHAWQLEWQAFSEASAEPAKVREIQRARIQQLEQHISQLRERRDRLAEENRRIGEQTGQDDLDALRQQAAELNQAGEQQETTLEQTEGQIREQQTSREALVEEMEIQRGDLQQMKARLASLRELQAAARGKHAVALREWLAAQGLTEAPRLSGTLTVEPGWERAVERVLGTYLNAVCVDGLDRFGRAVEHLTRSDLVLLDSSGGAMPELEAGRRCLRDLVRSEVPLDALLANVLVAEDVAEAMAIRPELKANESVITRSGVWVGQNWLSLAGEEDARAGMLQREQEIKSLESEIETLADKINNIQAQSTQLQQQLEELEDRREEQRRQLLDANRERAAFFERLGHEEARLEQTKARRRQIEDESAELVNQLASDKRELEQARRLLQEAEGESGIHKQRREELLKRRDALQQQIEQARSRANETRDAQHGLEIERQRLQTAVESTQQSVTRLQGQMKHLLERREELSQVLGEGDRPEQELKERLEGFLTSRLEVEGRLAEARQVAEDLNESLREQEQARADQEKQVQEHRQAMEEVRVGRQELLVRRDTMVEQIGETGFVLEQVVEELPDEATEPDSREKLETIRQRITRLGAINLVAIEEYEEEAERKGYLDKQNNDLAQALDTLEEAMRKIDRETRTRFKETFDNVNAGLQSFFPKLFGGGHAYLELTGDDLLSTGVTVMARPPGKRNSTIHLLSGGEKALTAVALLFSIFQLNPAPFCLLDEVDAPLDDANVERYCETLRTLSENIQLVFVTHNKISMEMAEVLIGVTMSEPGVSRLVAVDVDEAMEMVAGQ